jgi:sulfur-oxidizing protein SoxY
MARRLTRRQCLLAGHALWLPAARAASPDAADPFASLQWPDLRREFFGDAPLGFDGRVRVRAPAFAADAMNVPVSVATEGLVDVRQIVVFVDRNPIRRVVDFFPHAALAALSLRFKLEQASPVRAAALTDDGRWHVGGAWVDSAGGGCTVAGATRQDGSWSRSLGEVQARMFSPSPDPAAAARLRLRVMHPMDTGLVDGIPAFHLTRLTLRDAAGHELLRLQTHEPISENPVFSFDFARRPSGPLRLVGTDNNGNRIDQAIDIGGP